MYETFYPSSDFLTILSETISGPTDSYLALFDDYRASMMHYYATGIQGPDYELFAGTTDIINPTARALGFDYDSSTDPNETDTSTGDPSLNECVATGSIRCNKRVCFSRVSFTSLFEHHSDYFTTTSTTYMSPTSHTYYDL